MSELLTESFCERCGTRYTFESGAPETGRPSLKKARVLARGLKHFVLSDDSLETALAEGERDEDRERAALQLEAFHQTFNFCMDCRQYTCRDCWNEAEGRCLSCAPAPGLIESSATWSTPATVGAGRLEALLGPGEAPPPINAWPLDDVDGAAPADAATPAPALPALAAGEPADEAPVAAASPDQPPRALSLEAYLTTAAAARQAELDLAPSSEPAEAAPEAEAEPEATPLAEAQAEVEPGVGATPLAGAEAPLETGIGSQARPGAAASSATPPAPLPEATTVEPGPAPPSEPVPAAPAPPTPVFPPSAGRDAISVPGRLPGWDMVAPEAGARQPPPLPKVHAGREIQPAPWFAARTNATIWDASTADVISRPGSGVQACVSCGLPLSAAAHFCRRCGARQAA